MKTKKVMRTREEKNLIAVFFGNEVVAYKAKNTCKRSDTYNSVGQKAIFNGHTVYAVYVPAIGVCSVEMLPERDGGLKDVSIVNVLVKSDDIYKFIIHKFSGERFVLGDSNGDEVTAHILACNTSINKADFLNALNINTGNNTIGVVFDRTKKQALIEKYGTCIYSESDETFLMCSDSVHNLGVAAEIAFLNSKQAKRGKNPKRKIDGYYKDDNHKKPLPCECKFNAGSVLRDKKTGKKTSGKSQSHSLCRLSAKNGQIY